MFLVFNKSLKFLRSWGQSCGLNLIWSPTDKLGKLFLHKKASRMASPS